MTIKELHTKSMEVADLAFLSKLKGETNSALNHFKEAFDLEQTAIRQLIEKNIGEPTRSILLKSGASLALNSGLLREAEKLIALALSGEPPSDIAEELRNLLETVNFNRHLSLRGVTVNPTELQMVIAGNSVAYGMAKFDEIFSRISTLENLSVRTAERILKRPFREVGQPAKILKANFESYISVPRAASLAFTIRLGSKPINQMSLFQESESQAEIIEDILDNIDLLNEGKEQEVRNKIGDPVYYRNFIALTRELAPDGENISVVGMTIVRNGIERQTKITKVKDDIKINPNDFELENSLVNPSPTIEIVGRLSAADSDQNNLRISDKKGKRFKIIVPEGLGDIVRNYWDEQVAIKGEMQSKNTVVLFQIDKAN